jgi:GNAT superfamily N-acetyltransferase
LKTVFELPNPLYDRVTSLYADAPFDQPCYDSVFEGKQPARIFVDNADAPTAALMCRSYEYYHAGAVDAALRQFTAEAPEEAGVFADFYGYVPLNDGWKAALLADAPYEIIGRMNFQWQPGAPAPDWRALMPEDGRVVSVDEVLARRLDRECYPVPFIRFDWGSYEAYAAHGFGFALLVGDAIASTITAISTSSRHALINVATEPPFRKQGFATLVGGCFVEDCLKRGLLPVWDTDDTNLGSAATARRLGFTEEVPFVELGLPNRAKPERSRGLWLPEMRADGVTMWRRSE